MSSVGRRAHHRPELLGHALLADEEGRQPVHPRLALLGVDALVPVDAVLGEVEVLRAPLLALPQQVELAVAQELRLAAVGGLEQPGVGGGLEVGALGGVLGGRLGHVLSFVTGARGSQQRTEPTGWLASQNRARAPARRRRRALRAAGPARARHRCRPAGRGSVAWRGVQGPTLSRYSRSARTTTSRAAPSRLRTLTCTARKAGVRHHGRAQAPAAHGELRVHPHRLLPARLVLVAPGVLGAAGRHGGRARCVGRRLGRAGRRWRPGARSTSSRRAPVFPPPESSPHAARPSARVRKNGQTRSQDSSDPHRCDDRRRVDD